MSRSASVGVEDDDIDSMEYALPSAPPPQASTSRSAAPPAFFPDYVPPTEEEWKTWPSLYPIYLDAKRSHKKGERRVPRSHAVEWPQLIDLYGACSMLRFRVWPEAKKCHSRDWANPGRLRVELRRDGRSVHPDIRDKRALLMRIGPIIAEDHRTGKKWILGQAPAIGGRLPPSSPAMSHGLGTDEKTLNAMLEQALPPGMLPPAPPEGEELPKPIPMPSNKPKVIRVRGGKRR